MSDGMQAFNCDIGEAGAASSSAGNGAGHGAESAAQADRLLQAADAAGEAPAEEKKGFWGGMQQVCMLSDILQQMFNYLFIFSQKPCGQPTMRRAPETRHCINPCGPSVVCCQSATREHVPHTATCSLSLGRRARSKFGVATRTSRWTVRQSSHLLDPFRKGVGLIFYESPGHTNSSEDAQAVGSLVLGRPKEKPADSSPLSPLLDPFAQPGST